MSETKDTTLTWPPPYTLRYSKKSKHIHLTIRPLKGLEVVVPEKRKRVDVMALFEKHKNWLYQHAEQINIQQKPIIHMPPRLTLSYLSENWHIIYLMDPTRKNIQLTTCGLSKTLTFKLPEKITDHTLGSSLSFNYHLYVKCSTSDYHYCFVFGSALRSGRMYGVT